MYDLNQELISDRLGLLDLPQLYERVGNATAPAKWYSFTEDANRASLLHKLLITKLNQMKITKLCMMFAFSGIMLASCSSTHPRGFNSPPGHQKKAAGAKSARGFAPGQQKKSRW